MTEVLGMSGDGGGSLPIENLPAGALQAIYHQVTGKTENMSQSFDGNVLIFSKDIDHLHQMLCDQIATHQVEFGPTVTMDVKHANERSFHHSTWAHYKAVVPVNPEVTSEIILKFEFILKIQNTVAPQRCSISILLDSALPLIKDKPTANDRPWAFWMFVSKEWMTTKVSIDFVDFMVARGFINVIEEWFKGLADSPTPKINKSLLGNYQIFSSISGQMGRIGFAIFIAAYLHIVGEKVSFVGVCYAGCAALIIWSVYMSIRPPLLDFIIKRIASNIVPSVIILSDSDQRCYDRISKSINSSKVTIAGMLATILLSIAVNVVSCYAYSYLAGK